MNDMCRCVLSARLWRGPWGMHFTSSALWCLTTPTPERAIAYTTRTPTLAGS